MYNMEASKGEGHDEERFTREIELDTIIRDGLLKPLYYNRVIMGVDWNKHSMLLPLPLLIFRHCTLYGR